MNKNTILASFLFALLALLTVGVEAKPFKTIKTPESMACVNVHYGELKVSEVIFSDTATTVSFTMEYPAGQLFCFVKESYLMDEIGNRYPLRSAHGIALDTWVQSPENGVIYFTMHFQPMPKQTQVFDFIEGDGSRAFMLLGIHDKKYNIQAPTLQQLTASHPYAFPKDWLKTDTITVCGRIEDYDAEQFGFTSMECYFEDVFEKDDATLVLEIAPDGTFFKKFQASYPVRQCFHTNGSKVGFDKLPFFALPGETVYITVSKNVSGQYECMYNNGSSRDVQRWLRHYDVISGMTWPLSRFKGKIADICQLAETVWQNLLYRLQSLILRDHFKPMEVQLALADVQVDFAYAFMNYVMDREYKLMKQEERDGVFYTEITDTTEWKALSDVQYYTPLHRIDFNNPLLLSSSDFPILINRLQYSMPVRERQYAMLTDENGLYEFNMKNARKKLNTGLEALADLTGSKQGSLVAQICTYKDFLGDFNMLRSNDDAMPAVLADTTMTEAEREQSAEDLVTLSKMYPTYLSSFNDPYVHQKTEQFHARKMAQTELSLPLPDAPMADLIRSLSAKYPGRYLVIDFWGMGCGPCRSAIQSSKQKRAEIAKRDDVKLVFIAGERTTEGSDAYKNYVAEWLSDEETVCVTHADFTRLQELFRFNGIPHYETITPDCRRVRDDLRLNGFYSFDSEMKRVMERLK